MPTVTDDDDKPATRRDLRQLATKDELAAAVAKLATKDELAAAVATLATKAEVQNARNDSRFDALAA